MEDSASTEIVVVGYEGVVRGSLFMGGETTPVEQLNRVPFIAGYQYE